MYTWILHAEFQESQSLFLSVGIWHQEMCRFWFAAVGGSMGALVQWFPQDRLCQMKVNALQTEICLESCSHLHENKCRLRGRSTCKLRKSAFREGHKHWIFGACREWRQQQCSLTQWVCNTTLFYSCSLKNVHHTNTMIPSIAHSTQNFPNLSKRILQQNFTTHTLQVEVNSFCFNVPDFLGACRESVQQQYSHHNEACTTTLHTEVPWSEPKKTLQQSFITHTHSHTHTLSLSLSLQVESIQQHYILTNTMIPSTFNMEFYYSKQKNFITHTHSLQVEVEVTSVSMCLQAVHFTPAQCSINTRNYFTVLSAGDAARLLHWESYSERSKCSRDTLKA